MEKKYCAAPWRGLHINSFGDIKTCCAGDPNLVGNLNQQSINNALANPKLVEVRKTIQQGILHKEYCHNCIQAERYGRSERDWHNNVNEEFDVSTAELNDFSPSIIDIRWNITCNLACNYCGPNCSSRWASIEKKSVNEDIKPYYEQVVNYIMQYKHTVKEVALVGGEPLLAKENEKILDLLPEDVLITIISNMSLKIEENKIFQTLLNRPRVGWSMSFDNTKQCFEYVRYGADWQQMDKNVTTVANKINSSEQHGGIHAVYNLYNCTRLCELKQYAQEKNLTILWQNLHLPVELDPTKHCTKVQELAFAEIEKFETSYDLQQNEINFFSNVKNVLNQTVIASDSDMSEKFNLFTHRMETQYHPQCKKFVDLWPELSFLIKQFS